jgi:hypothetical protein
MIGHRIGSMSESGHSRKLASPSPISAFLSKTEVATLRRDVCFVPLADMEMNSSASITRARHLPAVATVQKHAGSYRSGCLSLS